MKNNKYILTTLNNKVFITSDNLEKKVKECLEKFNESELYRISDIVINDNHGTITKNLNGKSFKDNWKK